MVPRTSYTAAIHQSLGEGAAVMRAGRADREDFIAAAREQHGFLANVPADHAAIGKIIERDAAREIGSFRLGLLGGHNVLPIAGSTGSFGWRRTRRHAPIGVSRQSCVPRINCRCSYGSQYRRWPAVGCSASNLPSFCGLLAARKAKGPDCTAPFVRLTFY